MTDVATPPWLDPDAVVASGDRALDFVNAVLGAGEARVGLTPKEIVWRKNKARLYRYQSTQPRSHATPLLLVTPLINRAFVLDLRPRGSLVEYLLGQGFDVFLVDWGTAGDEDRSLDLTALITRYLPRAAAAIRRVTGREQMSVLGYCIGGPLAACFAALYPQYVQNLILLTAPIDFADAGQFGLMTKRGVYPIELLTNTFPVVPGNVPDFGSKLLNPIANWVSTYTRLWERLEDPAFDVGAWQAMNRWVNEGVPFPGAAFRQWIVEFYQENRLARGLLELDGRPVRLANITCPLLNIAASRDQIAPRSTTSEVVKLVGSADVSEICIEGGHVGIVVGRTASSGLWPQMAAWLAAHD